MCSLDNVEFWEWLIFSGVIVEFCRAACPVLPMCYTPPTQSTTDMQTLWIYMNEILCLDSAHLLNNFLYDLSSLQCHSISFYSRFLKIFNQLVCVCYLPPIIFFPLLRKSLFLPTTVSFSFLEAFRYVVVFIFPVLNYGDSFVSVLVLCFFLAKSVELALKYKQLTPRLIRIFRTTTTTRMRP